MGMRKPARKCVVRAGIPAGFWGACLFTLLISLLDKRLQGCRTDRVLTGEEAVYTRDFRKR